MLLSSDHCAIPEGGVFKGGRKKRGKKKKAGGKKYYFLLKCLQISRHQSLFQQIQWTWQEELLYSIVFLLLKINWARFFPQFLVEMLRIVYAASR